MIPKSYSVVYDVGEFQVHETFNKEKNFYVFDVKVDGLHYENAIVKKDVMGKKLIDQISLNRDNDCLKFESDRVETYEVCVYNQKLVDSKILENHKNDYDILKEFKGIKINQEAMSKTLIWAQKGYYLLDNEGLTEIMFLDDEAYYNTLPYQLGNIVITPDYDEDYTFSKFYLINLENGKLSEWKFDYEINYNSYYLGEKDGKVYLFDRKERNEYALDPKRKKIDIVSKDGEASIYIDEWEKVSTTKLSIDDYAFKSEDVFSYEIVDGELIRKVDNGEHRLVISKKDVTEIVRIHGNEVFYLVGNRLYKYSPTIGEVLVAEYSEWNFNYKNSVFIY